MADDHDALEINRIAIHQGTDERAVILGAPTCEAHCRRGHQYAIAFGQAGHLTRAVGLQPMMFITAGTMQRDHEW